VLLRPNRLCAPLAAVCVACVSCDSYTHSSLPDSRTATATANPAPPDQFELDPYIEVIPGIGLRFEMRPVPGGTFTMGSPAAEAGRRDDEGPQRTVRLSPFWIGKCEVTWDEYSLWADKHDQLLGTDANLAARVDGVTRPTPPYTDMTFGMGREGFPAICMTQHAAKTYCAWLSAATGRHYRLPTEAEWEYACRAGTNTAFSFGDDPKQLGDYAWFTGNSRMHYHEVGRKKPNAWGLHDMHGNVAEWVLDQYIPDFYAQHDDQPAVDPCATPTATYPRVVRGGSWQDDAASLRCSARRGSEPSWKEQDPQIPKSIWYHTDATFVGFRVVRQLEPGDK